MDEVFVDGQFLGLPQTDGEVDVVILPLAFELTTSYGTGTADGPRACIEASGHVELYDPVLKEDLPAGMAFRTEPLWEGSAGHLMGQLDEMVDHVSPWYAGQCFPLFLGGEHGILPPIVHAARHHPLVKGDLSKLTLVQIDAHADLRESLDGEPFSHACAAARSLDLGVGNLLQAGIRAYSLEEAQLIETDERITTFFACDTQHPPNENESWLKWLDALRNLSGPVHLTIDIDGLDGALVPATGTPVPGGLSFWQVIETIETLFSAPNTTVISADVNEIVAQEGTSLTQFTAASLATKVVACHLLARKEGRWSPTNTKMLDLSPSNFFQTWKNTAPSSN
ncbi:MAG TPA: arginase family protein [Poseidonia sp.]|nr:arginase family protein [Poseidonia sp.]